MQYLFKDIQEEIVILENELRNTVRNSDPIIEDTTLHLIDAGGKRLRPALCFLGGKFYQYDYKKILPLAVVVEMTHMATLVHDDVVDASMTRRSVPTIKALYGNKISVHLGDYLLGKTLKILAGLENTIISKVLAETSVKMCQGEIQQLYTANTSEQTIKDYFYRIKRKTALLISASCQIGALACGAPSSIHLRLREYGHCIGMAFQITDDILDIVADRGQLGKPVGGDLKQGIVTLPFLIAVKNGQNKDRLLEILKKNDRDEDDIIEACRLIIQSGGVEHAKRYVDRYIEHAKKQLSRLPDIPARDALYRLADFIAVREF